MGIQCYFLLFWQLKIPLSLCITKDTFAKALVIQEENEKGFGQIFHVPNAETITTSQFLTLMYEEAGYKPKIRATP